MSPNFFIFTTNLQSTVSRIVIILHGMVSETYLKYPHIHDQLVFHSEVNVSKLQIPSPKRYERSIRDSPAGHTSLRHPFYCKYKRKYMLYYLNKFIFPAYFTKNYNHKAFCTISFVQKVAFFAFSDVTPS